MELVNLAIVILALALMRIDARQSSLHRLHLRDLEHPSHSLRRKSGGSQANGTYSHGGTWSKGYAKAKHLVSQMTIEEKVNVTSGVPQKCVGGTGEVPRLKLRSMCFQDAGQGVRTTRNVSQFPAEVTTAATWDVTLMSRRATALAEEFVGKGVNVMLGPVTGGPLGRSPLSGRTWENWSPDEYLSGVASYVSVKAAQKAGIVTCSKHAIFNEQETSRNPYILVGLEQQPISVTASDKATHQLYGWPFAEAIRAGTGLVMCSYNKINGSHACADDVTLEGFLKGELGFQGAVVSDWGGTWNTQKSAAYGLDVSMPGSGGALPGVQGSFFNNELLQAVKSGQISESRLSDMAIRLLTPILQYQDLKKLSLPTFDSAHSDAATNNVQGDHAAVVRKIGEASVTLLKNSRTASYGLPLNLKKLKSLAVIGEDAGPSKEGPAGCNDLGQCTFGNTGTVTIGGGSGFASAPYISDPLSAIKTRVGKRVDIKESPSNDLSKAEAAAGSADAAIVFVSVFAAEGADRSSLALDGQGSALIKAVADSNKNTIVVIHAPGPVDVEAWVEHPSVRSVLMAYYPGQESGRSLVPILFGDRSPSGKLPFTIAKSISDYPPHGIEKSISPFPSIDFTEGTRIDWKWLEAKNVTARFEFGHGLSYTTFKYGHLKVTNDFRADDTSIQPTAEPFKSNKYHGKSMYDQILTATVSVQNVGDVKGAEVAQLYLSFPASSGEPRVLRGFSKLSLQPDELKMATFSLRRKDISIWDTVSQRWIVPTGPLTFGVGSSSQKIHSTFKYTL